MAIQPSQNNEDLAADVISDAELQQVNGGVALVTGVTSRNIRQLVVRPQLNIPPFSCTACVQGVPRDLVTNPAINPVLRAPLGKF